MPNSVLKHENKKVYSWTGVLSYSRFHQSTKLLMLELVGGVPRGGGGEGGGAGGPPQPSAVSSPLLVYN